MSPQLPDSRFQIELIPLERIKPTEDHAPAHAEALRQDMEITGLWTHPLLVDRNQGALMEGKTWVYNFNKGTTERHRYLFSAENLAYLEDSCGAFIRFCNKDIGLDAL